MDILQKLFYGKHYFQVAKVLRSSLFLSSVLTNCEAWYSTPTHTLYPPIMAWYSQIHPAMGMGMGMVQLDSFRHSIRRGKFAPKTTGDGKGKVP